MKRIFSIVVSIMMVISMIPAMAVGTYAVEVEGMWYTLRAYGHYIHIDEETGMEMPAEIYTPAPGYKYTAEGFQTVPADYHNTTPFFSINSKECINVNKGFYMEVRVDNYSYAGEPAEGMAWGTADNWLSFHLSLNENINPNNNKSGQGWVSLIRHGHSAGGSVADPDNIIAQAFCQYNAPDKSFLCTNEGAKIVPAVDDEGRRIYTFSGIRNADGTYNLSICGVDLSHDEANAMFAAIDPEGYGEFYIGFTMSSAVEGGVAECTITKFGTSLETATVPEGCDAKEPDGGPNICFPPEMIDSATVPAGYPALLFNALKTSWKGSVPKSQNLTMTAQGNGVFMVGVEQTVGYWTWEILRDLSYNAADFPVIAVLIEDPHAIFTEGQMCYAVGGTMNFDDAYVVPFSKCDDDKRYGEDEDTYLCIIDMKAILGEEFNSAWAGRINALRFESENFSIDSENPENNYFFLHWIGVFRSVEEAQVYGTTYLESTYGDDVTKGEDVTEPEAGDAVTEGEAATNEDATVADGTVAEGETKAEDATATATTEGGCASVIGVASVILAAAAAAVVLKKKD